MTIAQTAITTGQRHVHDEGAWVARLCAIAREALRDMYLPDQQRFVHCRRKVGGGTQLEGVSERYTAMALIGLNHEPADVVAEVLHGQDPQDVCGRMIERTASSRELGEVAMALWCARALNHADAPRALEHLRAMAPHKASCPTVEVAWALTGQVVPGSNVRDEQLTDAVARRLMASYRSETGLFPHWPVGAQPARLRAHVACYADLVYPIQALSHYATLRGDSAALKTARACAERMCALQGAAGQWWWHYDVRTGRVVEPYPVYSVHQDAMGPMALFAVREACADETFAEEAVSRGLTWLRSAPELEGGSLVDEAARLIWRKVGRREPGRLIRSVQAGMSRLHPSLRVPQADRLFPPGRIDFESRPYHMGWILYAWRGQSADARTD